MEPRFTDTELRFIKEMESMSLPEVTYEDFKNVVGVDPAKHPPSLTDPSTLGFSPGHELECDDGDTIETLNGTQAIYMGWYPGHIVLGTQSGIVCARLDWARRV